MDPSNHPVVVCRLHFHFSESALGRSACLLSPNEQDVATILVSCPHHLPTLSLPSNIRPLPLHGAVFARWKPRETPMAQRNPDLQSLHKLMCRHGLGQSEVPHSLLIVARYESLGSGAAQERKGRRVATTVIFRSWVHIRRSTTTFCAIRFNAKTARRLCFCIRGSTESNVKAH